LQGNSVRILLFAFWHKIIRHHIFNICHCFFSVRHHIFAARQKSEKNRSYVQFVEIFQKIIVLLPLIIDAPTGLFESVLYLINRVLNK